MPYIVNDKRSKCDMVVDLMKDLNIVPDGEINYILYKFCKDTVRPSYGNYKQFLGELDCCKLEIYRRLVSSYENKKIDENGDV